MASGQLHEVAVLVAVDGVADGTGLDADMMAGAAAVHGSLMRLVVKHHGLHAGFGSAHGALGIVDGQQHGGVGLTGASGRGTGFTCLNLDWASSVWQPAQVVGPVTIAASMEAASAAASACTSLAESFFVLLGSAAFLAST